MGDSISYRLSTGFDIFFTTLHIFNYLYTKDKVNHNKLKAYEKYNLDFSDVLRDNDVYVFMSC